MDGSCNRDTCGGADTSFRNEEVQFNEESTPEESAARLQTILDTTVDGIVTIDEDRIVLSFNKAAERIFGYSTVEVIGRNVNILMPSPYREEHDSYVDNYLRTGRRKIIGIGREVAGRRKDGTTFPMYLAVSEAWVGNKRFFTGIVRDITEIKRAEMELKSAKKDLEDRVRERTAQLLGANARLQQEIDARKEKERALNTYTERLEQTNRDLEDFAFIASHDLQEPLRKIQTFCDLIVKNYGGRLDQKGRNYLEKVQNSARRMRDLIQGVLMYTRISTPPRPFGIVDLSNAVQGAVRSLEVVVKKRQARIEVGELPVIEGDPGQLQSLFRNLIENALKFSNAESPFVRIHSQVQRQRPGGQMEDICRIEVEDNGIGFEEKYQGRIFIPLQRLHGKRSPYDGTGMGLAICRKIVERHSGSIIARSSPGKGSTFVVTLPLSQRKKF